jgi:hypothetical protein
MRALPIALCVAIFAFNSPAQADVILNTYPLSAGFAGGVGSNSNYDQRIGVPFSVSADATLTSFTAAMAGLGTYRFGVQAAAVTAAGSVPSSLYLHSAVIVDPAFDASLSGLQWDIPAGSYYFVIQGDSFPSNGSWRTGTGGTFSVSVNNGGWSAPSGPAFATLLNGTAAPIPEPTTLISLLIGLTVIGATRRGLAPRSS